MKDLARRIAKLEDGAAGTLMRPDPGAARASKLQTAILACWRGNYNGRESLAEAHCRALEYRDFSEYKLAFISSGVEVIERHNRVWNDFLAEHGVGPQSPPNEIAAFLEKMLERVPERVLQGIEQEVENLKRLNSGQDRVSPPT